MRPTMQAACKASARISYGAPPLCASGCDANDRPATMAMTHEVNTQISFRMPPSHTSLTYLQLHCRWQFMGATLRSWTREEDKLFELALVVFPEGTPDRWFAITMQFYHRPGGGL
ncbi:hypothetical protein GW17_00041890 [Ensete ventricosum]|nr:hypothetical protein GW17_00041890 [Ensete ventricosum]